MSIDLYDAIYRIASALEVPIIVLSLAALAYVVVEAGAFGLELFTRRRRRGGAPGVDALTEAAGKACVALDAREPDAAEAALSPVSWSAAMDAALRSFVDHADRPGADSSIAKDLADFDFGRQRRLGRTRLLVRAGPALDGLAKGNVSTLTDNLRVAFSVTVLGIFVGAVAFGISLVRERVYGQDYSDLEYIASVLSSDERTRVAEDPT